MFKGEKKLFDKVKQLLCEVPSLFPVIFRQAPNENHGGAQGRVVSKPRLSMESASEPVVVSGIAAAQNANL